MSKKVDLSEKFAALRRAKSKSKMERAVNEYQRRLGLTYAEWVELASEQLENVPDDKKEETIIALILLLRQMLQADGRRFITEGMHIGLGSTLPTPDLDRRLQNRLLENDNYMGNSLIPAVDERIRRTLADPNIVGATAFAASMMALQARTELYAGAMWTMMQDAIGEVSKQKEDPRIRWVLDDLAQHCPDCPRFAGEYDSFDAMLAATNGAMPGAGVQCNGNCRCHLEYIVNGEWTGP